MHPSVFFAPESWILRQTLTHTRVRIFSNNLHKAIRHPRDGQGLLGLAQRKPAWVNFAALLTLLNKWYIVNSTLSSMETSSPPRAINMHADRYHFPQRACRIIECGKMPTRSAGGGRAQGLLGFTILRSPHFFFFFLFVAPKSNQDQIPGVKHCCRPSLVTLMFHGEMSSSQGKPLQRFLLALIAYRLLCRQQNKRNLRTPVGYPLVFVAFFLRGALHRKLPSTQIASPLAAAFHESNAKA